MLRIYFTVHIDINDITYGYFQIGTTTGLEPTLGLIVACVPMFPAAFKNVFHRKETRQPGYDLSSDGWRRFSPNGQQSSRSHGINDFQPLADPEEAGSETTVPESESRITASSTEHHTEQICPPSRIKVTHDWDVRWTRDVHSC